MKKFALIIYFFIVAQIAISQTKNTLDVSIVIEPVNNSILYYGYSNFLDINAPDSVLSNAQLVSSRGNLQKISLHNYIWYVCDTSFGRTDTIFILDSKNENFNKVQYKTFHFYHLPYPIAEVGNSFGGEINRNTLLDKSSGHLSANYSRVFLYPNAPEFVFISKFKMVTIANNKTYSIEAQGNNISEEQKSIIKNLDAGAIIIFKDIVVRSSCGQLIVLQSLVFELMD